MCWLDGLLAFSRLLRTVFSSASVVAKAELVRDVLVVDAVEVSDAPASEAVAPL